MCNLKVLQIHVDNLVSYLHNVIDRQNSINFYFCGTNSLANVPPVHNWMVVHDGEDIKGEEPAPTFVLSILEK